MSTEQTMGLIFSGAMLFLVLAAVVWYILRIIAYWKVFTKAGEAGWKSIIPFYNLFVQYRLTWKPYMAWIVIILLMAGGIMTRYGSGAVMHIGGVITAAGVVFNTIGLYKLSKSFGHGGWFTVGLFIFEPLFTMILGFGKSVYIGNTTENK